MTVVPLKRDESPFPSIPGELTETGLKLPENLPYDEWERVGKLLQTVERSVRWWIGDWLAFGERKYGETYTQAVEATGYKTQDLMNMVYVSTSVPVSVRTENLSWSHHERVASLEPESQRKWLERAEAEHLSVKEMTEQIKARQKGVVPDVPKCKKCGNPCRWCGALAKGQTNRGQE